MDYEQLKNYQKSILDRALTEGIRRNEEQRQTWSEYKTRHEKVIEALETFSKELTVECMVPIGKRALMRGKLTHTNEILVSLGEGYFAKYSASQSIALCDRRIKRANEILESLDKELNLYEMRQRIPEYFDAFGGEERKDLIEHWDKEKLDDWRVEHRQREKEYKKKLAESKNTEKQNIKTEDDLFEKLDALELQEELEAELHRLEASRPDYYAQDLGDGEVYEESDESSDETEDASEDEENRTIEENNEIEEKIEKLKIRSSNDESTLEREDLSTVAKIVVSSSDDESKQFAKTDLVVESTKSLDEIFSVVPSKSLASLVDEEAETSNSERTKFKENHERRVAFGESRVKYFHEEQQISSNYEKKEITDIRDEKYSNEDDIVRIEFKHTEYEPEIIDHDGVESFTSPRDIYKILSTPKSILKNSCQSPIRNVDKLSTLDESTDDDDDDDDDQAPISAYSTIVRDVKEYVIDKPFVNTVEQVNEKRPVSRFKRERAGMNK